jgi:uncharacterized membrane protein HdeD (DUF308 family)
VFDREEFKEKVKKRILITGLLTLVCGAYFLFAPSPSNNFGLGILLLVSLIGLIVSVSAMVYYIVKFVGV